MEKDVAAHKHIPVIVIGGGQAGLAVSRQLAEAGIESLILETGQRIGDSWRRRWDSLRLFSAAGYSSLPGMAFPGDPGAYPTKDEVADYLEQYSRRARLRVRFNTRVEALDCQDKHYRVTANGVCFEADEVVIATGAYQTPKIPAWAGELDPAIKQLDAGAYKNPGQLPPGDVLVVGAGNTGAELALELEAAGHNVWLAGRSVGHVPRFARVAHGRLFWFLARHVFTEKTPVGRKIQARFRAGHGGPLVRIRSKEIEAANIRRVGRVLGTHDGQPALEGGRVLDVASVLWCTGFHSDFRWIHLPIFAEDGYPLHHAGLVTRRPGLYFIGLPFQRDLSSSLLGGVGRDATMVASWIAQRLKGDRTARQLSMAHI